jgi:hypothetical protein
MPDGRRRRGVRCDRDGEVGVDTDDGDTLWLCAEHLAELLRMRDANVE